MQELPNWLAAAVMAAGMTTVYNADDWARHAETPAAEAANPSEAPASPR